MNKVEEKIKNKNKYYILAKNENVGKSYVLKNKDFNNILKEEKELGKDPS